MPMRLRVGVLLALLAGPAAAGPAGCPQLVAALEGMTGYRVTAPLSAPEGGWCVLDRAVLQAEGAPDLAAGRLRLRGEVAQGALVELAAEAGGLRLAPGLGQGDTSPVLRETLRLQSAELTFVATSGPDGLALRQGRVRLSGGTEVAVEADVAGAGLSAGSLLMGRLTWATVDWRNDGRLLRPVMASWGESLVERAGSGAAVDAARLAAQRIVRNLPATLFRDDGQDRVQRVLDAVPQGKGRLALEFRSAGGIGAAQLAVAAFSDDPLGPAALARVFAGAQVAVDWQPGLAE